MGTMLILFYFLAFLALSSAVFVVISTSLVRSIFMLFVTLFAVAGLYIFALADFIALTQIVIYVGGVLVMMLFALMLSNKELLNNLEKNNPKMLGLRHLPAIIITLSIAVILFNAFTNINFDKVKWIKSAVFLGDVHQAKNNQVNHIGINIMTNFMLPFEIVSIFLMMALIGAAHLVRKDNQND